MRPVIGIGMVGYAFMGRTHSQAWRSVDAFFDLPFRPSMVAVAGRSAEATAQAAIEGLNGRSKNASTLR
ncbi:hypothetical protein AB0J09_12905, partial [Nonomuraea sp. NPDC049784]